MSCYARGPVCPYECMPCDECPASKPEYAEAFEETHNSDAMKVKEKMAMKNVEYIPCYEEACKQIEGKLTYYMRFEDWNRSKTDIWAFWRTMRCFIVCENEVAILENMYASKMGMLNKAMVSKKDFVAYMMHTDIFDC